MLNKEKQWDRNKYYPDGSLMCEYKDIENNQRTRTHKWTWFDVDGEVLSCKISSHEMPKKSICKETIEDYDADGTLLRKIIKINDKRQRAKEKYLYYGDGSLDTEYSMSTKNNRKGWLLERVKFHENGSPAQIIQCKYGTNRKRDVVEFYVFKKDGSVYNESGCGEFYLERLLNRLG